MQLAYWNNSDASDAVLAVVTDMAVLPEAGRVEVGVRGIGLQVVEPRSDLNCERWHTSNTPGLHSLSSWSVNAQSSSVTTTYFSTPSEFPTIQLYYTLRLTDREVGSQHNQMHINQMHITVWREVAMTHAACAPAPQSSVVALGHVMSCSGVGSEAVAELSSHSAQTHAVRGEIGALTSFVARALTQHVAQEARRGTRSKTTLRRRARRWYLPISASAKELAVALASAFD